MDEIRVLGNITREELLAAIEKVAGNQAIDPQWRTTREWSELWKCGMQQATWFLSQANRAGLCESAWAYRRTRAGFEHRYPVYRLHLDVSDAS